MSYAPKRWPKAANAARRDSIRLAQEIRAKVEQLEREMKRNPDLALIIAREIALKAEKIEFKLETAPVD